ncbi:MAG: NUDIX hydrolase, partial [Alphaproteobacteria bacterium]
MRTEMTPEKTGNSETHTGKTGPEHSVIIGLNAAIIAVWRETPHVLVVRRPELPDKGAPRAVPDDDSFGLPFGPFDPALHRTLEIGLRSWVEEQAGLSVGYVEQLYTFGDRGRYTVAPGAPRVVSVGYLALTRPPERSFAPGSAWHDWYRYFPWEDWRSGKPAEIDGVIAPRLEEWAHASTSRAQAERRRDRARLCFGLDSLPWDDEKVLERYELLYEARLVAEAPRDERRRAAEYPELFPAGSEPPAGEPELPELGVPMQFDHRRILATAMSRLRGKLKYRPLVFELMPEMFTLLELQRTVEAISGTRVHKQNFRRLVERSGLVERTGRKVTDTGGRPAEQFRFRREVLRERPAPGVRLSPARLG